MRSEIETLTDLLLFSRARIDRNVMKIADLTKKYEAELNELMAKLVSQSKQKAIEIADLTEMLKQLKEPKETTLQARIAPDIRTNSGVASVNSQINSPLGVVHSNNDVSASSAGKQQTSSLESQL